jgi:hypothetical protein
MAGLLACAAALSAPARPLPDSFEMLAVGRCMLGLGACGALDPLWWPPLYGVLAAGLDALLPTGAALILPALLPMALAAVPLVALAGRLGGRVGAVVAGLALAALPALHTQAMTGDARGLGLALAAGAWVLATGGGPTWRAAAAGALAGLAVLARTEAIVVALLVPLMAGLRWGQVRAGLATAAGVALTAGPWWLALSLGAGGIHMRPRAVEGWAVPLLDVLPKADIVRLIGASAGDTPFRAAAVATGAAPGGASLDISGGVAWLLTHAPEATGPLIWLLPLALGVLLRTRHRWTLAAVAAIAAPAIGAALVPQGRDALAPLANLLPLAACTAVLAGGAVGAAHGRWGRGKVAGIVALGVAVPLLALQAPPDLEPPLPGLETRAPGRALVADLAAARPGPVQATFESAPLVHLSGRPWVPWPDPWLPRDAGALAPLAVVTDLDPGWRSALRDPTWDVTAIHGDDRGWTVLLERRD